jgi:hypothetical protein
MKVISQPTNVLIIMHVLLKDVMSGTCSTHGGRRNACKILIEKRIGKNHF